MQTPLKNALFTATGALWMVWSFCIIRQILQMKSVDPTTDTGLSFGLAFLLRFALPVLLGLTVILVCVLVVGKRRGPQ